jgi:magnesium-transporting ATPase (P-type)
MAKFHELTVEAALKELEVDEKRGLSTTEAEQRLGKFGPNELPAEERE